MKINVFTFNSNLFTVHMSSNNNDIPLYIVGLSKDKPFKEFISSKFKGVLQKGKKSLPEIIEAKISVKSQNTEGERTHYNITSTVITSKNRMIHTESGWDVLKICDELCRKLEREFSSRNKGHDKRQRKSIRKKEEDDSH